MDPRLDFFLSRVSQRFQRLRLGWLLTCTWSVALVAMLLILFRNPALFTDSSKAILWVGVVILSCFVVAWLISRAAFRDRVWLASQIERVHPDLNQRLITAVSPRNKDASGYLRKSLTEETLLHAYIHNWNQVVPKRSMWTAWFLQSIALALVLAIVVSAASLTSAKDKRLFELFAPAEVKSAKMQVQPGDSEIERGTNCLVTVRFEGSLPDHVSLNAIINDKKGIHDKTGINDKTGIDNGRGIADETVVESTRLDMQRSLNDPVFASYLTKVVRDTEYFVESDMGSSDHYRLRVFDFPALVRSDAELILPAYSKQEPRLVKDARRVTVPEGTSITWICNVNKPLATVELVDDRDAVLSMSCDSADALIYKVTTVVEETRKWKLHLKDDAGRSAKILETFVATVLPNNPPKLKAEKITDATVSSLEELSLQAKVRDDFSLNRAGVQYSLAGGEMQERILLDKVSPAKSSDAAPALKESVRLSKEASIQHLLDFEAMGSEPDQLLTYSFWAEDIDREGKVRRVDGEMYFAEVRPFDEIFRQGQSPAGESEPKDPKSSPQAQKAEELAELQKKLISATWNMIRAQTSPVLSKQTADDVQVLVESQNEAVELAKALEEKITDEKSKKYLDTVLDAMDSAINEFESAVSNLQISHLKNALKQDQAAYEGLLRLRAREHEIVQSKKPSSKSSSSSQQKRQKQLDQMELKNDTERYETEKQAAPEEEAASREMRQVMSRLDELARRQEDINRQLKDIETAIQAAKTVEEKKELEEQLKRLRENEEELLRDTDELAERMQSSEQASEQSSKQREAMQEAQQQVAQAREEIRQAAEALTQSQPSASQALSSGTRAEKQIEETRDKLREQSSQRFEETMKDMLSQARELEKKQTELSEKTLGGGQPSANQTPATGEEQGGLRPGTEGEPKEETSREQVWQDQQKKLSELLEQMQETVTQAEPSEPLLADKLYETFRETKQRDIERRLDLVPRLVERGLAAPVQQTLDEINTGMRELREGVEKAAESVLGNEVDGLRRALNDLDQLERQLKQEIATRGGKANDEAQESTADASEQPKNAQEPDSKSEEEAKQGKAKSGQKGSPKGGSQHSSQGSSNENTNQDPNGNSTGGPSLANLMERSSNPITGANFGEWSDSLRDVEESVRNPEMRGRAAGIRQSARELRRDYQRHSKEPQWELVQELVAKPLAQLRESVQAELLRKSADRNAVVPIDRDPVPTVYEQRLRQYYENLGSQKAMTKP